MRCWLLRSWVRMADIEVEEIAECEGRIEDGDAFAEAGEELPLDLV